MTGRALAVLVMIAATAHAAPHVVETIGATSDVHDVAIAGDDVVLATSGGVAIVRGERVVQTLGTADGLPGARVLSATASDDGVWVGGVDGAALLARDGDRYRVARTLPLHRVTRVARFAGDTWLATFGGGLYRMADGGAPARVAIGRDRTRVSDLLVVGDRLWVATIDDGIVRVRADGRRDDVAGLASEVVWDLEPDGNRVLAATAGGVDVVPARGRARPLRVVDQLPVRDVRSIARRGARTWVATFGGGAWRLAGGRAVALAAPDGMRDARVIAVAGARVIVGGERGAAVAEVAGDQLTAIVSGGLPSADVTALASAFGSTWIGTFSHGVARLHGGVVDVPREVAAIDPRVNDLAVADGKLWIATDRGLWWFDGARLGRDAGDGAPGDDHVTALHVDAAGALWVAGGRSLARRDASGWRSWTGEGLTHLDAVATDAGGHAWAAGLHGVVELAPATGEMRVRSAASGELAVDWATAVVAWQGGVVVGTYDAGLSWLAGARARQERLADGWVNPHAMRVAGGTLWIGTLDRGLAIGATGAWTRLRIADQLPSDDVTALLPAGDRAMWVGTRGGLARLEW
ncbi:MAG: hypothetical protein ACM31C_32445 [Acidobacteriota bacterium]